MTQLYCEIKPTGWLDMKNWFWALGAGNDWVFRGQQDAQWDISSSLERAVPLLQNQKAKINKKEVGELLGFSENNLIGRFSERVEQFTTGMGEATADSLLGTLALMQHHGVPTRLTDWSESPYVAAFFAIVDITEPKGESAIWAISSSWCQDKSAQTVRRKKKLTKEQFPNYTDFSSDEILEQYILVEDIPLVAPLRPLKLNLRIASQQGLFLCPGDLNLTFMENLRALGENDLPNVLYKFVFPSDWRNEILHDLFNMNISPQSLFPGLDGFARSIKLKMKWENEASEYLNYVWETALKNFNITYYTPSEE